MSIKRHVGRIKNTDRRCAVVLPQLPEDPEYALIVDTDALPDYMHESLVGIIDSASGQESMVLGEVLSRRASPDSGLDMLNSLHRRGLLQKQKISNIMMFPRPNSPVDLSVIVDMIAKTKNGEAIRKEDYNTSPSDRFRDELHNNSQEKIDNISRNLIKEAEMLEQEAHNKREQAYHRSPHLRPNSGTPESIAATAEPISPVSESIIDAPGDIEIDIIDDPTLDPETRKILEQARAHLQRSSQRIELEEKKELEIKEDAPVEEKKEVAKKRPKKAA